MPYLLLIAAPLVFGLVVLTAVGITLGRAVRRFGRVRGWLDDYLADRTGRLRARSAALGIALGDFRDGLRGDRPRTIDNSLEREDHRA